MTEIEGKLCSNFRQSKNPKEQIVIDADVYCLSTDEIIDMLIKYGYDAEQYREKKKNINMTGRKRKFDEAVAQELYNSGKSDIEIGKILGINRITVHYWRKQNNLKANKKSRTAGTVTAH